MKSSTIMRGALMCACLFAASTAVADGWEFPSLNPFKTEKREVSAYTPPRDSAEPLEADKEESGFRLPKFKMPSFGFGAKPPGQPSTMEKLGRGTKNFFSKTADVLTPWDNDDKPTSRTTRSATGVRRKYSGSTGEFKAEKKSFVPSWFFGGDDEEEDTPRTVNSFIAQPRPKF